MSSEIYKCCTVGIYGIKALFLFEGIRKSFLEEVTLNRDFRQDVVKAKTQIGMQNN